MDDDKVSHMNQLLLHIGGLVNATGKHLSEGQDHPADQAELRGDAAKEVLEELYGAGWSHLERLQILASALMGELTVQASHKVGDEKAQEAIREALWGGGDAPDG